MLRKVFCAAFVGLAALAVACGASTQPAAPAAGPQLSTVPTLAPPTSISSRVQLSWRKYVIDPKPSGAVVEKAWVDVLGRRRLDAVIGMESSPSQPRGGGLYWYQFPTSGNPADRWVRHTIRATGNVREDIAVLDVNRDGRPDIITSVDNKLYWFENPGKVNGSWKSTLIGSGYGENELRLGDLDHDGRIDVVTSSYIYFQNSPQSWTRVRINPRNLSYLGTALLDIGSGHGPDNIITTGPGPKRNIVWYENPAEHGGNPRVDRWILHTIGPGYACPGGTRQCPEGSEANVAAGDLNGDGRMDVVISQAEGHPAPRGGLQWYEAPVDRSRPWVRHTIDASFTDVHNVALSDLTGQGRLDLVAGEQDQSKLHRVAVFYNDGRGSFTEQILSYDGTHNVEVGRATGGRVADILAGRHGYFGASHPIEVYVTS